MDQELRFAVLNAFDDEITHLETESQQPQNRGQQRQVILQERADSLRRIKQGIRDYLA